MGGIHHNGRQNPREKIRQLGRTRGFSYSPGNPNSSGNLGNKPGRGFPRRTLQPRANGGQWIGPIFFNLPYEIFDLLNPRGKLPNPRAWWGVKKTVRSHLGKRPWAPLKHRNWERPGGNSSGALRSTSPQKLFHKGARVRREIPPTWLEGLGENTFGRFTKRGVSIWRAL